MKKKSGITLVILVVTIIIMIIVLGITVISFNDLLKNTQKNRLKTNLYLVKGRAEVLLEEFKFQFDDDLANNRSISQTVIEQYLGGNLLSSTSPDVGRVGFASNAPNTYYCEWDIDTLKSQGIDTKNIAENEKFIIKYDVSGITEDVDVASLRGYSGDGTTIYRLSEME